MVLSFRFPVWECLIGSSTPLRVEESLIGVKQVLRGILFSLAGGLIIAFSGGLLGSVGWGAYRASVAIFLLVFSAVPQLALGALVSICAITQKRALTLTLSIVSLLWFLFSAITNANWTPYLLACITGIIGGVLSILSGLWL